MYKVNLFTGSRTGTDMGIRIAYAWRLALVSHLKQSTAFERSYIDKIGPTLPQWIRNAAFRISLRKTWLTASCQIPFPVILRVSWTIVLLSQMKVAVWTLFQLSRFSGIAVNKVDIKNQAVCELCKCNSQDKQVWQNKKEKWTDSRVDVRSLFTIESVRMMGHGNGLSFMTHLTILHTICTLKQLLVNSPI